IGGPEWSPHSCVHTALHAPQDLKDAAGTSFPARDLAEAETSARSTAMRSRAVRSFNGPPSMLPFARALYSTARTRSTTISLSNSAYMRGNSLFVLLWFSKWQGRDLRRACFQSLRRHIFNGLFSGEEFSDWSTTIVVMAAFDSAELASLRSLTEVFGSV